MTCIVGLVEKGVVWMGGDTCGSDGWASETFVGSKVFTNGPFLLGYTSSFRYGQLMQNGLAMNRVWLESDLEHYMRTTFIDCLRNSLKAGGWSTTKDGRELGGDCLIGVQGRLFHIQEDYAVIESRARYDACGSGYLVAKGALAALHDANVALDPEAMLTLALRAAEKHVAGVRAPFNIIKQEPPKS